MSESGRSILFNQLLAFVRSVGCELFKQIDCVQVKKSTPTVCSDVLVNGPSGVAWCGFVDLRSVACGWARRRWFRALPQFAGLLGSVTGHWPIRLAPKIRSGLVRIGEITVAHYGIETY